eukprot:1186758-Prorocentrum_minimum.AAC.1
MNIPPPPTNHSGGAAVRSGANAGGGAGPWHPEGGGGDLRPIWQHRAAQRGAYGHAGEDRPGEHPAHRTRPHGRRGRGVDSGPENRRVGTVEGPQSARSPIRKLPIRAG